MLRITKAEVRLCFERFLIDAEDDFFPDPLRYRDLRLVASAIVERASKDIRAALLKLQKKPKSGYLERQYLDWDVPKGNDVVRHAVCIHPLDRIVYHFILNRLAPLLEPKLSPRCYSYKVKNCKARRLFGKRPVQHWLAFKNDAKNFFSAHKDHHCLVSTDVAGFFEYTHILHFKNTLHKIAGADTDSVRLVLELLNAFLRHFSPSRTEGIPQNYDPSSYLASAFLDFLDKELDARGFRHFRYVDDIKVACRDRRHAQQAILEIIHALRRYNLNLSTAKTEIWHRDDPQFVEFFRDFPDLLDEVDGAVNAKDKELIDLLLPKLTKLTRDVMKKRDNRFDERLFRACIWRILKCHWFRNVKHVPLDAVAKRCLGLLDQTPGRTDSLTRFLVLLKNKKSVHSGCAVVIESTVYPWQERLLWELLTKADKIQDRQLLALARDRVRHRPDSCPARDLAMVFLGKHGTYQDREYIASIVNKSNSFVSKRCALIALQEYPNRSTVYSPLASKTEDPVLQGLIKYLKQLKEPEYVLEDKRIGSDLLFEAS